MNDSQVIKVLEDFSDHLNSASIFIDPFRWLIWMLVKGISVLVDGLESVTNEILLLKTFFNSPAIQDFLVSIRPALYILFALSLLYTFYLILFKRKVEGEVVVLNLIISVAILTYMTTGMNMASDFTDGAIETVGQSNLYNNDVGSVSENIIVRNMYDLMRFDQTGWSDKDVQHAIPPTYVKHLNALERFDSKELNIKHEKVAENHLTWKNNKKALQEFDQGGIADWNNVYYYRYDFNWFSIITTLLIMMFTLFTIAIRLAKLSFELAFNQILATIIAPTDLHDGQKTKKIIQNIFNVFMAIILIFLSMRLYVIGVEFLNDNVSGIVYIIALIGFSLALIDGPSIVERLYGIDAGLKNGWGVLAAGMAASKLAKAAVGTTAGVMSSARDKLGKSSESLHGTFAGSGDKAAAKGTSDSQNNSLHNTNTDSNASSSINEQSNNSSVHDATTNTTTNSQNESASMNSSTSNAETTSNSQSETNSLHDATTNSTTSSQNESASLYSSSSSAETTSNSQSETNSLHGATTNSTTSSQNASLYSSSPKTNVGVDSGSIHNSQVKNSNLDNNKGAISSNIASNVSAADYSKNNVSTQDTSSIQFSNSIDRKNTVMPSSTNNDTNNSIGKTTMNQAINKHNTTKNTNI